ncbi:MAG TPA: hypothetical protein DCS42_01470 [Nitrospiraceae bacterium]|nr:MAG: hypothetical protein A2072_00945 [Nitrospirae bacterium GWC1_57_7]OGW46333.1 MAG: hypothetical protein A2X57_06050 [Nitrospirae bacterium GWD2_57_8]HAR45727.1 hypothetical protein [Nitrospiraceae bacterium]HAS52867.1 hypothetical protein [Nitrospiraceae bacterium]
MTSAALKILGAVLIGFAYFISSLMIAIGSFTGKSRRRRLSRNVSFFARFALRLLVVRVRVRSRSRLPKAPAGRLIVSNHLSSLDILVLASLMPVVFITSVELRRSGLPGLFALAAGSLFVERQRAIALRGEITTISRAITQGFSVVLFPEGTSSDGSGVQPFKNALFDAAIRAGAEVLPLCIRYSKANGKKITIGDGHAVFYHGIPFLRHVRTILALQTLEAEVAVLERIPAGTVGSRKKMASLLHKAISEAYHR